METRTKQVAHTPGPLAPHFNGNFWEIVNVGGGFSGTPLFCAPSVAQVFGMNPEADARLFAASPDHHRLLALIAVGDWPGMIALAQEWGCLPEIHNADRPAEYELMGEYSTDARYIYPTRQALLLTLARAAIARATAPTPTTESHD
jgi:hypothetical protein